MTKKTEAVVSTKFEIVRGDDPKLELRRIARYSQEHAAVCLRNAKEMEGRAREQRDEAADYQRKAEEYNKAADKLDADH